LSYDDWDQAYDNWLLLMDTIGHEDVGAGWQQHVKNACRPEFFVMDAWRDHNKQLCTQFTSKPFLVDLTRLSRERAGSRWLIISRTGARPVSLRTLFLVRGWIALAIYCLSLGTTHMTVALMVVCDERGKAETRSTADNQQTYCSKLNI
jgi:hypothetical protein